MAITTMIDSPAAATSTAPPARRRGTFGADKVWALAFVTPYVAIFVALVIYPIGYGLWLGSDPASYRALFDDPVFPRTVMNTLVQAAVCAVSEVTTRRVRSGYPLSGPLLARAIRHDIASPPQSVRDPPALSLARTSRGA